MNHTLQRVAAILSLLLVGAMALMAFCGCSTTTGLPIAAAGVASDAQTTVITQGEGSTVLIPDSTSGDEPEMAFWQTLQLAALGVLGLSVGGLALNRRKYSKALKLVTTAIEATGHLVPEHGISYSPKETISLLKQVIDSMSKWYPDPKDKYDATPTGVARLIDDYAARAEKHPMATGISHVATSLLNEAQAYNP